MKTKYSNRIIKIDRKVNLGNNSSEVKLDYFRDLPCEKDIFKAYFISYKYNIINSEVDIMGAILLKWLLTKKIEIKESYVKILFFKIRTYSIILSDDIVFDNDLENELYSMMKRSSNNNTLNKQDFISFCLNNYDKVLYWFSSIIEYELDEFRKEGISKEVEVTESFGLSQSDFTFLESQFNNSLDQKACELKGLKNFLNDFSKIKDKSSINVKLWEYYLIYAQMFGIADKVIKELGNFYLKTIELPSRNDLKFINKLAYIGVYKSFNLKSRISNASIKGGNSKSVEKAVSKYSAGGGGISIGGGGSGSFGGGSGGGTR